ncbi:hypothetical protein ZWY2020_021341 [Hordeum vulgare]|nr:hypothetical protein ZWY2020_021341 [Hordeum vulgare]
MAPADRLRAWSTYRPDPSSRISTRAILKANCYHAHGHDVPCSFDGSYYMLMFGGAQLLLSFIPDFHDMAWLSVVAVVMSFS